MMLGDVIHGRHCAIDRLGFADNSTIWLARHNTYLDIWSLGTDIWEISRMKFIFIELKIEDKIVAL